MSLVGLTYEAILLTFIKYSKHANFNGKSDWVMVVRSEAAVIFDPSKEVEKKVKASNKSFKKL